MSEILIFGGDKRLLYAAEMLNEKYSYHVTPAIEIPLNSLSVVKGFSTVIIPIPFSADGKSVYTPFFKKSVPINIFFENCHSDVRLIGGTIPETYSSQKKHYYDLTKDDEFIKSNLQPTIEGIIQYILNSIEYSISGSKILIIGFGRLGKMLAKHLQTFGAEIAVACSNNDEISVAKDANLYSCTIEQKSDRFDIDIIVNTVPAHVLTEQELKRISCHTMLIDVASVPGG